MTNNYFMFDDLNSSDEAYEEAKRLENECLDEEYHFKGWSAQQLKGWSRSDEAYEQSIAND